MLRISHMTVESPAVVLNLFTDLGIWTYDNNLQQKTGHCIYSVKTIATFLVFLTQNRQT